MAIMYPKNIHALMPIESELIVYNALKEQLPDTYTVFYSISWMAKNDNKYEKSEADFIILSEDYGFLCLEVKGGSGIKIIDNEWYISSGKFGDRKLSKTPYEQAEKNMYYLKNKFSANYNFSYNGIFGACVVLPFYSLPKAENISERDSKITIDCNDMNNLYSRIKQIFKIWGGESYTCNRYTHHEKLLDLVKKNEAISAAKGALIEYKSKQLEEINRVQDNYIYFLDSYKQFYIRGGAGTGKTWIGMKLAKKYSSLGKKTLFLCASQTLARWIKTCMDFDTELVDIMCFEELISIIYGENKEKYIKPLYKGLSSEEMIEKKVYDAIIIDEAQDFNEEWAYIVKLLLKDELESYLNVFFDDVQILRENTVKNVFMIDLPPFLLRENIRNTANIYKWATDNTKLGKEVILNPVEGPLPKKEVFSDKKILNRRLENLFKEFIEKDKLKLSSIVILTDNIYDYEALKNKKIAAWELTDIRETLTETNIFFSTVENFKGLEADMIIYIHNENTAANINYIAYTRARYYLYELVVKK